MALNKLTTSTLHYMERVGASKVTSAHCLCDGAHAMSVKLYMYVLKFNMSAM